MATFPRSAASAFASASRSGIAALALAIGALAAAPAAAVSVSADGDAGVYGFQQRESRVERVPHGRALHAGWDRAAAISSPDVIFLYEDSYGSGFGHPHGDARLRPRHPRAPLGPGPGPRRGGAGVRRR